MLFHFSETVLVLHHKLKFLGIPKDKICTFVVLWFFMASSCSITDYAVLLVRKIAVAYHKAIKQMYRKKFWGSNRVACEKLSKEISDIF